MQEKENDELNIQEIKLQQYIKYHRDKYFALEKQIQDLDSQLQKQQQILQQLQVQQNKSKQMQNSKQENNSYSCILQQQQLSNQNDVKLGLEEKTITITSKTQNDNLESIKTKCLPSWKKQQNSSYRGRIYMLKPIAFITNDQLHRFEASRQSFLGPSEKNLSIIQYTPQFMRNHLNKNENITQIKQLDFNSSKLSLTSISPNKIQNQLEQISSFNLEVGKYYLVQFVFDRNFTFRNMILPPKARQRVGLFSSRTPHRPNPVGQSIGQVVAKIDESTYVFRGLDLLHKTPILQIQLYQQHFDIPQATTGWMSSKSELIKLYYDENQDSKQQQQQHKETCIGNIKEQIAENEYQITNLEVFTDKIMFLQHFYSCDVSQMIVHKLSTSPMLSRTHKIVNKEKSQILAIGVFRVQYQIIDQRKIEIINIYPAISNTEINETYQFDEESDYCKRFQEMFPQK